MTCERLATGTSTLHTIDPRVKLCVAFILSVTIALLENCPAQFTAFAGGFLLICWARLPLRETAGRLAAINFFVFLVAVVVPFTTPGTPAFTLLSLPVTWQGLELALSVWLKCNAIAAVNLAFLATSTIFSLAHALAHLKVPSKLVQLFFFSWRYIHVLEEELGRIRTAAALRGFRPSTSLHTYRTIAWMTGALLIKGYERGERVYMAMQCRGFNGTFWLLSHFHFYMRDGVIAAGGITATLTLVIMDAWGRCILFN